MVERPIKKSDLPPQEATDQPAPTEKQDRNRKKPRSRDRNQKREAAKPAIPPALVRGPKPQPPKPAPPPEATAEESQGN
ncbi:MAG: hypothetical protein RMK91_10695 [Pseudanabaenaceae cyanobacterium SKYGB_i_bin29]|nr:hypothetical protein [Pseudanabaenaceae cyanobacterium SKYG29]MDW8422321.1 hypothetical protein [Pseudanabaenaceae cyanobacterium SKYGB_i_bin29]